MGTGVGSDFVLDPKFSATKASAPAKEVSGSGKAGPSNRSDASIPAQVLRRKMDPAASLCSGQ